MPRFPRRAIPAAVLACTALPAPLLHQALAATAGTLFEAAPFVLAVTLVRGRLARWSAALFGCGCGRAAGYAALSLPAAALCSLTFGPWVACARLAAALALQVYGGTAFASARARVVSHRSSLHPPLEAAAQVDEPDPLAQLESIALAAFGTALFLPVLGSRAAAVHPWDGALALTSVAKPVAEFVAGLIFGTIAPCTTAAVAMAAMLRANAPFSAGGILMTAGLVPHGRARGSVPGRKALDGRIALFVLAGACAVLAIRGGSGFVHPRLVPMLWLAVPATLVAVRVRSRTGARFGLVAPLAMAVALIVGSPLPQTPAAGDAIEDLYPGEPIDFTGQIAERSGHTALVRYVITCCRADATAVVVPTNLRLRDPPHTWLRVSGIVTGGTSEPVSGGAIGLSVFVTHWQRVPVPADPFAYR